jgi:hypothetical protein
MMDNPRDSNRVAVEFLQRVAGRSVGSAVKA